VSERSGEESVPRIALKKEKNKQIALLKYHYINNYLGLVSP